MRSSIVTLLVMGLGGAAGAAAVAIDPASSLMPLTATDGAQLPRSTCRTWFTTRTGERYLLMTAGAVAVRTDGSRRGLRRCPLTPNETDEFGVQGRPTSCGGRRLTMRLVGPGDRAAPGRASGADATLLVERGGRTTSLTGRSETECGAVSEEP